MDDPIILLKDLQVSYKQNLVLSNVSMEIHSGDFWCFIGSNGSGKTTLIKCILGAIKAKGLVLLRKDFANRTRIGFVPQETDLNPNISTTIKEFISCGMAGIPISKSARESRVAKVLDIMEIQRLKNRSIWNVSGGQRQRAMVARALARDPLLMIVDEPTSGLDLAAAQSLLKTITQLNQEHSITVIFVTHDLNICSRFATHVAMFQGTQVISGTKSEVFTKENLATTFGIIPENLKLSGVV